MSENFFPTAPCQKCVTIGGPFVGKFSDSRKRAALVGKSRKFLTRASRQKALSEKFWARGGGREREGTTDSTHLFSSSLPPLLGGIHYAPDVQPIPSLRTAQGVRFRLLLAPIAPFFLSPPPPVSPSSLLFLLPSSPMSGQGPPPLIEGDSDNDGYDSDAE